MSVAEGATVGPSQVTELSFPYWTAVRRCALALYAILIVVWSTIYGIPVQRELVIAMICGALVCFSLGRPPRMLLQIFIDWLPLVIVLGAYDATRGAADSLGIGVHTTTMIDFDRFLFFGHTPTEWIQAQLGGADSLQVWDVGFSAVYTTYFIVPFALGGWLWARDRFAFVRYIRRLVTLAAAGLATYILFPAAPPWMAGEQGLLEHVHRTTAEGFQLLGVQTASLFTKGQSDANLVAAVPSLHAGFTMLVALVLWSRIKNPRLRPLLLLYPLAMAITLISTGEHYAFDIFLGWAYTGAVMLAWKALESRSTSPAGSPARVGAAVPEEA